MPKLKIPADEDEDDGFHLIDALILIGILGENCPHDLNFFELAKLPMKKTRMYALVPASCRK